MDALGTKLGTALDDFAEESGFWGAALVRDASGAEWRAARGLAHIGFEAPNTASTRFDTASLSKLFTAAAAFRLAAAGRLGLDERIGDIVDLSGTRIPGGVTVRHCLTHSSGIADDADEEAEEDYEELWKDKPCYRVREARDFLPNFAFKEPRFAPGTAARYNNCAFVLVGLALEARSGKPFREFVEEEVFAPAGMGRAGYFAKDGVAPDLAEGYADLGGRSLGESGRAAASAPGVEGISLRKNLYAYPPIGSPDAGAYVTAGDLAAFFDAVEGESFLPGPLRDELLEPRIEAFRLKSGDLRLYGHAFEHDFDAEGRRFRYGKDGMNPGVAAIAMRYPGGRGLVVALSNRDHDVWTLCRRLAAAAGLR